MLERENSVAQDSRHLPSLAPDRVLLWGWTPVE